MYKHHKIIEIEHQRHRKEEGAGVWSLSGLPGGRGGAVKYTFLVIRKKDT